MRHRLCFEFHKLATNRLFRKRRTVDADKKTIENIHIIPTLSKRHIQKGFNAMYCIFDLRNCLVHVAAWEIIRNVYISTTLELSGVCTFRSVGGLDNTCAHTNLFPHLRCVRLCYMHLKLLANIFHGGNILRRDTLWSGLEVRGQKIPTPANENSTDF